VTPGVAITSLAAIAWVAGCGGGASEPKTIANTPAAKEAEPPAATEPAPPAEPTDPGDRIIATMRGFKDDACACPSTACIAGVEQQMLDWAMAHVEELKDVKPTRAQDAEADRIEDEMDACKARHASAAPRTSSAALTPLRPGGTGAPACDEYVRAFDTIIVTCKDKLGPAADAMIEARNMQVEAFGQWDALDAKSRKATLDAAEAGCKAASDAIRQSATAMGCPL
jgi:hypothetical protein